MEERIEDKILAFLRGEFDCDTLDLLREARAELIKLRENAVELRWAADAIYDRADSFAHGVTL